MALPEMKCAGLYGCCHDCARAFTEVVAIHCEAVEEGRRWSAQHKQPVCNETYDFTLTWVPESWVLSSLQDEFGSLLVTGGASVGDHRLLSANLSGLIAGIPTAHIRAQDFACKPDSACLRNAPRVSDTLFNRLLNYISLLRISLQIFPEVSCRFFQTFPQ